MARWVGLSQSSEFSWWTKLTSNLLKKTRQGRLTDVCPGRKGRATPLSWADAAIESDWCVLKLDSAYRAVVQSVLMISLRHADLVAFCRDSRNGRSLWWKMSWQRQLVRQSKVSSARHLMKVSRYFGLAWDDCVGLCYHLKAQAHLWRRIFASAVCVVWDCVSVFVSQYRKST